MSRIGSVVIVVILLGVQVLAATACDCAPPPPPKKAFEQSAAVLLGKVLKIEDDLKAGGQRNVTLEVERWWKGGESTQLQVSTSKSGASCGFGFQVGGRYLVYAHGSGEGKSLLRVSLCSRTRFADAAKKSGDFDELGEGTPAKK